MSKVKDLEVRIGHLEQDWQKRYDSLKTVVEMEKNTLNFEKNLISLLLVMEDLHVQIHLLEDELELERLLEE